MLNRNFGSLPQGYSSRALTFFVQSTKMPPMQISSSSPFRTADRPLSLFEGLAGAVCAWADACVFICKVLGGSDEQLLGFPCIGGVGGTGLV